MKNRKREEKPIYNVWQNMAYVISNTWIRDKTVLFIILAEIFIELILSLIGLFLPKTVVFQVTYGVSISPLVITVIIFTAMTIILQSIKSYLKSSYGFRRSKLRIKTSNDILMKCIQTDYNNLEDQKFNDAKQKANDIVSNNSSSAEQIYYTFSSLGINILGFVIYIILLISVNPFVLLITSMTTVFGVLTRQWAAKWQHDHDNESVIFNKRLWYINSVGCNFAMAKDIRLFPIVNWLKDVYNTNMRLALDFSRKVQIRHFFADLVDSVAVFAREGIAYAYLIWQVLNFELTADNFVLIFAAIGGFSGWIIGILNDCSALSIHSLNYCRLREFLEYPNKFKYDEGEPILHEKQREYSFEFRNVSFRYSGAEKDTLKNINLIINAGEKIAVVGLNGAGKSTFVKLLCGFYDPTEGQIFFNGKDVRNYNRKEYYTLFTAVFQEFDILPLSIVENISQRSDGNVNENKIQQCIKLADLYDKIKSLPNGMHSLLIKSVNEDAIELSGGEMQKLLLSRALYKDAPVMVLDEPASALDPIAESKLYNKYNELSYGKTSIYISHRLASARFCDRIILIDNNTIVESGSHDELLKLGGKYAELFKIQGKYYNED